MENLSNMCICLHGSGARRPPYTNYYAPLQFSRSDKISTPVAAGNFFNRRVLLAKNIFN